MKRVFGLIKAGGLTPTVETFTLCLAGLRSVTEENKLMASFIIKDMINQVAADLT